MKDTDEMGRATQDELRDDLSALFRGAIRVTLEMVLEEELKAMVGARRFELMGERVGRSTVSRVAKRLDEAVEELRTRPIDGPHPYLYLDATFLDARWARKVENVSALVAYAVDPDGHRRLLGVTLGPEESEASWSELLTQLVDRGLSGVQLVIADEHAGLAAAVRKLLPEAQRQRCTVHLQRNVGAKVPHRLRKRVAREVSVIFKASGRGSSPSAPMRKD